jgi:hypothetical protein
MDPLEYGKLIDHSENKYLIQVNDKNLAIITQLADRNEVIFFKIVGFIVKKICYFNISFSSFFNFCWFSINRVQGFHFGRFFNFKT